MTSPQHRKHQPIVVVGNGPVGQTTALLLARWGLPVLLLDQRPHRDLVGSKAICQQRDVLDVWDVVGAGRQIADAGLTWNTARTFYRDRELFSYALPDHGGSSFPPFVNISQAHTERILDERIAADPLIQVRWGYRVTGIIQNGRGVELTCSTPSGPVDVSAGYAVVCAGARGDDIHGMLGVRFDGHSFDDRFLICDIRTDLPGWRAERRFYFDPDWNPGRQVLIHPCPDSVFRIDWQVPDDYDVAAEEADGTLDWRIRTIIGDRDYQIVWKSVYRFHSRVVDRMRVGRVLLAGDCAHVFAPFGARGLNSGVADAENAAWKLAFVANGWATPSLLDSYHDERHAAALENLDVTSATMRFLVPQNVEQRRRRRSVLDRALVDATAWSEVDSGRLAEPFWYVASPLTTSAPGRPFAGRPARGTVPLPGPGILVPDTPVALREGEVRLPRLARDGLLLLATTDRVADIARTAASSFPAPARVLALPEIDDSGSLAETLTAGQDEIWLIRPDAHVAAALTSPTVSEVVSALSRSIGGARLGAEGNFEDVGPDAG